MGLLERLKQRVGTHAGALKLSASSAIKEKVADIRQAIGPEKVEPIKQPERAFGREGAGDVTQIVWTGHTVVSPRGHSYYGAVGLTKQGYYRTAEVQVYGAQEKWRWEGERYMKMESAVAKAETVCEGRKTAMDGSKMHRPKW